MRTKKSSPPLLKLQRIPLPLPSQPPPCFPSSLPHPPTATQNHNADLLTLHSTTPDPIVQILYGAIAPITGQTTRSLLEILRTWEDYRPVMWREPRNVQEARSELQVRGVVDEEGEVVVDEEMLDMGF